MVRLGARDLKLVVEFLGAANELDDDHPFDERLLEMLRSIIPSSDTSYVELDRAQRLTSDSTTSTEMDVPGVSDEDYFRLLPHCPMHNYWDRTGDFSATRISDLISLRQWRENQMYRELFYPIHLEHALEIGLPAPAGHNRIIVFWRERGSPDLSDRDHDVLDVLRPHLVRRQELSLLRRRVSAVPALASELTSREREILALVAQGRTNAEVAAVLWVAPGTVKKHLENVYEKLGVSGRAAAVARLNGVFLN